ncbi:MAG TPA: dinitrogenase iron-molybdenum cofactor [Archaeoglobus veneficus]|nr:dinitrogenase iron-molybdenum cofactor [Archaeoglobus veneficus]
MKIAASTNVGGLDDKITPMFGRAPTFTIVDVKNGEITAIETVKNTAAVRGGGAGIAASQTLADKGVEVLLTGNVGPNAISVLNAANIKIYRADGLVVEDAVKKYLNGELEEIKTASQPMKGKKKGGRWFQ